MTTLISDNPEVTVMTKPEAEALAVTLKEDDPESGYEVRAKFGGYVIAVIDSHGMFVLYL